MAEPYYEVHDGDGPYLLMVHGFLSSRAQWQPNLAALQSVCRPVVLELYGHGRSPSPEAADHYTPSHYNLVFEQIREQLAVPKWFVLGYSLGAGLTLRYALHHPDRVLGSLFTNSTSALADQDTVRERLENAGQIIAQYERGGLEALEKIPVHPRHARQLDSQLQQALLEDCARLNPGGVARTMAYTSSYCSVRGDIHANRTPTLLLHGVREKRFDAHRDFLAEHMPHLDIQTLDAGHAVNAEAADDFNEAVIRFIKQAGND